MNGEAGSMMGFFDKIAPTLLQGIMGASQMNAGFQMQISSAEMSAKAYRQAADVGFKQAAYNVELDRQSLFKNLDSFSREIGSMMGTQRTQMATTGISSSSKSFLALTNKTLDVVTGKINDARNANTLQAQQRRYAAQVNAANLENQALSADYEADIAKWKQGQAQSEMFGKMLGSLGGLFGGGGGGGGSESSGLTAAQVTDRFSGRNGGGTFAVW